MHLLIKYHLFLFRYELIEQRKTEYEKLSSELAILKETSIFQHPEEHAYKEELQLMAIEIEET